jgi:hypothetical protein
LSRHTRTHYKQTSTNKKKKNLIEHDRKLAQRLGAHARDLLLGPQADQQVELQEAALLAAVQQLVDERLLLATLAAATPGWKARARRRAAPLRKHTHRLQTLCLSASSPLEVLQCAAAAARPKAASHRDGPSSARATSGRRRFMVVGVFWCGCRAERAYSLWCVCVSCDRGCSDVCCVVASAQGV